MDHWPILLLDDLIIRLTIAHAQINSHLGDVEANLEKYLAPANVAHASRADLIVFPELSLTGNGLLDLLTR